MHLMPEPIALLHGLRQGDDAAFQGLIQQYQHSFQRVARNVVSNEADVEDVLQDTWMGILIGAKRFEGRSSLKTWAYTILTYRARACRSRERKYAWTFKGAGSSYVNSEGERVERDVLDTDPRHSGDPRSIPLQCHEESPERLLLSKELLGQILSAVEGLPSRQKQVFILRHLQHLVAKEVCNILSISETNQRVLLHRARVTVRRALERNYGDSSCSSATPTPMGR